MLEGPEIVFCIGGALACVIVLIPFVLNAAWDELDRRRDRSFEEYMRRRREDA